MQEAIKNITIIIFYSKYFGIACIVVELAEVRIFEIQRTTTPNPLISWSYLTAELYPHLAVFPSLFMLNIGHDVPHLRPGIPFFLIACP